MKTVPYRKSTLCALALFISLGCVWQAHAALWTAYFGNLHSHTGASDGVDTGPIAYAWAKQEGQLNFLCLSEHNHLTTQAGLDGDVAAATAATASDFIALVGQEYSTLPPNGGNHVNVHNVVEQIPKTLNNNYKELFHTFLPAYTNAHPNEIVVCQFNHPENPAHDYGAAAVGSFLNYAGDSNGFLNELDPWVRLIAIISGPADSDMKKTETPPRDAHQDSTARMVTAWMTYLDKGFHLSPVADQDNHRHSWGTRTTARTGVWLDEPLSKNALLRALKAGRSFATEDKDLRIWFELNGSPMGSKVPDAGTGTLTFTVIVTDPTEPNSRYQVELMKDTIHDGMLATPSGPAQHGTAGQTLTFTASHTAGVHEAYFVHVKQEDTPQDRDDAWTGPIWVDPALTGEAPHHTVDLELPADVMYLGSKNSLVYHFPECRVVHDIAPANLRTYTSAPPGKHLHKDCPTN